MKQVWSGRGWPDIWVSDMWPEGTAFFYNKQGDGILVEGVGTMREFETGATRDTDDGKLDYEGFFAPAVLERYAQYMHKHRVQADGELRDSANWQKGMPQDEYMKSAFRHFMDWWTSHRAGTPDMEALCALMFNVQGYMFEELRD